ncbi:MAG TPA: alcohol dehydrogenase catalytic domain-containing protein [Limnochordales bacterium]
MKAVRFSTGPLRFVLGKLAGRLHPSFYTGPLGSVQLAELPPPSLPGPDWAVVRVRLGGVCGSDLHTVTLDASPSMSVFSSMPFVLGHENVGVLEEVGPAVAGFQPGQRVVVEPLLPCRVRGIDPPCPACQAGEVQQCHRFTDGRLAPGLIVGSCRDTGGSWAEKFVAHSSQLVAVPEGVSDEAALMAEPFAVALHSVLRFGPGPGQTALVIGCGAVGLCTVAALRAAAPQARVVAVARHAHQARMAGQLGAHRVVQGRGRQVDEALAGELGARLHRALLGPPVPVGGADVTFECVGSARSITDALRFTRPGGRVVLAGLASTPRGVDWTPIWLKELELRGTFCYGLESWQGRVVRTLELALELMAAGQVDLAPLVTHKFPLSQWRRAIDVSLHKRAQAALKVALFPD